MAQESVDNINNLEQMQTQVFNTVVDLYNRYKDSPYMINRMQTFITNLPNLLDAENKKYEERVLRMNELTMEQDNFFKVYLSKHQYFYMPYITSIMYMMVRHTASSKTTIFIITCCRQSPMRVN